MAGTYQVKDKSDTGEGMGKKEMKLEIQVVG